MNNDKDIIKEIFEVVDYVMSYVEPSKVTDWLLIKKQIVFTLKPKLRSYFSRRHYSTKKHIINEFEQSIINYWKKKTGVQLIIFPEYKHDEDWVERPRGWKLFTKEVQEKRKRNHKEYYSTRKANKEKDK